MRIRAIFSTSFCNMMLMTIYRGLEVRKLHDEKKITMLAPFRIQMHSGNKKSMFSTISTKCFILIHRKLCPMISHLIFIHHHCLSFPGLFFFRFFSSTCINLLILSALLYNLNIASRYLCTRQFDCFSTLKSLFHSVYDNYFHQSGKSNVCLGSCNFPNFV